MPFSEINLQKGSPSPDLLPTRALASAATRIFSSQDPSTATTALSYGPGLGHTSLRLSLAAWLSSCYKPLAGSIPVDRISITGGASQNLANILQVYTDTTYTRGIWMIEPTYFLACKILEDAGFKGRLRGVPEDEEGCDAWFLREKLRRVEEDYTGKLKAIDEPRLKTGNGYPKIYKHIIYCVPTFSNPSGKTLSLQRRQQLVLLAREFDALVITDDCYDFLRWPLNDGTSTEDLGLIPPRLTDVDRSLEGMNEFGNSVSNGTFSKLVGPGMRVGWAEGTSAFIKGLATLGATRSGGNPSQFSSSLIDQLLQTGGLQEHIGRTLIPSYRARYRSMMGAIDTHLVPLGIAISTSASSRGAVGPALAGGFFTYIMLPADLPTADIVSKLAIEKYNLKVAYGKMFQVWGDTDSGIRPGTEFDRAMRLCWAWETDDAIVAGVQRLGNLIKALRAGGA